MYRSKRRSVVAKCKLRFKSGRFASPHRQIVAGDLLRAVQDSPKQAQEEEEEEEEKQETPLREEYG
jgi:hypothetical protein